MITKNDKRLGATIQKLRKKVGLTQDELSEKAKISPKYLQFIEGGSRQPSLSTLYKLAKELRVKVKDLFEF